MVGILANTASALDTGGKFALDGNPQDPNGATLPDDWETLFPSGNPGQSLGRTFVQDLEAGDTSYFTGGSTKDDLPLSGWLWDTTSHAPDKNDITNAYAASYLVGTQTVVMFGADRFDVSGDAQMGFWFFQDSVTTTSVASGGGFEFDGDHTVGDVLVLVDFTNGGTSGTVSAYTWVGSGGNVPNNHSLQTLATGGICDGSASQSVCAIANTSVTASPWPYVDKDNNTSFQANAFIEGGINLSALFPNNDKCFASFLAETRSSQEVGATLKDFALGGFHSCPEPTLATTSNPTGSNVAAGTPVTDTLTVTGVAPNGFPSGTASFWLCGPAQSSATVGCPDGSGTFVSTATVGAGPNAFTGTAQASVTGASTQAEGLYCWRASYTPDSNAHYTAPTGSHTNNTTECFTVVKPNISVLKTAANGTISAGQTAGFTVAVHNDGPGTATTVTVSDPLPNGITWSESSDPDNVCSVSGGSPQNLACTWPTMAAGTTHTVSIEGVTDAADCGTLTNTATVGATNEGSNQADNTSTATISVQCGVIHIAKTADPAGPVLAGEDIGFRIDVWKTGAGDVTSVTVHDTLPTDAGTSWTVGGPDASACSPITSGELTCDFGTISSNATTKTITLSSPTTTATCGVVDNTASVTTTNDGSESSTATVTVTCPPDVKISKAGNGPLTAGQTAIWTIGVSNDGFGPATSVTVTDTVPSGITWTIDPAVTGCAITSGVLSCDFGTLAAGATRTVTLKGTTNTGSCPSISNTATVAATNELAGDHGNNSASATINVTCPQFFENPTTTTLPPTTTTQPPQVLPEQITTIPPTTTTAPTTTTTLAVLGVQLARTGADAAIWLRLAGMFLVAGGLLLLAADKRVWPVIRRQ